MDRREFPVSVVPYPIDKAASFDGAPDARSDVRDASAEWDSRWLRPHLNVPSIPTAKSPSIPTTPTIRAGKPTAIRLQEEEEQLPKLPLYLRILHWLFPEVNQRRAMRYPTPGLVAYYWTGGAPYSYQVGDMSATGLFLLTKERWAPGTLIQMTIQRQDGKAINNSICVLSEVVRWGENGSGFNFVLSDYEDFRSYGILPTDAIDRKSVERFLQKAGIPNR